MRVLIATLTAFIVIVAGGSVATYEMLDQGAIRERIADSLYRQTGLRLATDSMTVQVMPWPAVSARGVVLTRPGHDPVFRARSIHAGISLLALLHREIRLERLTVEGASLSLRRDASGDANWSLTPPVLSESGAGSAGSAAFPVHARWTVSVEDARVADSAVGWRDEPTGQSGGFDIAALDLAGLRGASPALGLQARHGGAPFRLAGRIGPLAPLLSGVSAPWPFAVGFFLGDGKERDTLALDGRFADIARLSRFSVVAQGDWPALRDAERLFPRAGLPDLRGLGGEIALSGDAGSAEGSWAARGKALLASLTPTRIHLRAESAGFGSVAAGNVHLDADSPAAPLDVAADISARGMAWRLIGKAGTLEAAGKAARDRLAAALPVEAEIRSLPLAPPQGVSLTPVVPAINAEDGMRLVVTGMLGREKSSLALRGEAVALHPPAQDPAGIVPHDVTFAATLDTTGLSEAVLDHITFRSREAELDGSLHFVADGRTPPLLAGRIHAARIDLDALSASSAPVAGPNPGPGAAPAQAPAQAPVPAAQPEAPAVPDWVRELRARDVDLHLAADRLNVDGGTYTDAGAHLTLSGGRLRVEPIGARWTDRTGAALSLSGAVDLDASALPVKVSVSLQPLVLPAALLERRLGIPPLVQGAALLAGQLSGQGSSAAELRGSLGGHVGVSVVDGKIDGRGLARFAGPEAEPLLHHGALPLRCLGLHLKLANDVAVIDALGLQSGRFSITGHGQIALGTQQMTLHLSPSVDFGGTGASTPVLVTGALSAPRAEPDRDDSGRFRLVIGGAAIPDPCPAALSAAREGLPGPALSAAPAPHHSRAGDILHALGILH